VYLGSNRFRLLAALATAGALAGCANIDFDASQQWFAKPLNVLGTGYTYTYSELQAAKQDHSITPSDLVDGNGGCAAQPQLQPQPQGAAVAPDPTAPVGGALALGMSECDVVRRAGQPAAVELGTTPNGDRTAAITYRDGAPAGVYHFERGRLMQMDRIEQPVAPPQAVKKKPAKAKKPVKPGDAA